MADEVAMSSTLVPTPHSAPAATGVVSVPHQSSTSARQETVKTSSSGMQLNKLKSFLGTLQAYNDPNEDDHAGRSRRKRIDSLIDSLVACTLPIEQFFTELKAVGYPISESDIATTHGVVKNGLPLLKAEMQNTLEGSRSERSHPAQVSYNHVFVHSGSSNDRRAPVEDVAGHSAPPERERGDRSRRSDRQARYEAELPAKRPYHEHNSNGGAQPAQLSHSELMENLHSVFYQLQGLMEQFGSTMYALRAVENNQVVLPAGEVMTRHHPTVMPPAYIEPRRMPSGAKLDSPLQSSGRPPHHYAAPPQFTRVPVSIAAAGVIPVQPSHHVPMPVAEVKPSKTAPVPPPTSTPRSKDSKNKHRGGEEGSTRKHRNGGNTSSESCWCCGAAASETCSRCKKARYCGQTCQRVDWNDKHHRDCKSPPAKHVNGQ